MQAYSKFMKRHFGPKVKIKWTFDEQRADWLQQKADLKARWEKVAEDGKVAVIRSGMDCDCTQYERVVHVEMPYLSCWLKDEEDHQQWLDGPEYVSFGRPSDYPERSKSRDRALEAYEDGHPHLVTWGNIDE